MTEANEPKIEKGIPVPIRRGDLGGGRAELFRKLEIGDSVLLTDYNPLTNNLYATAGQVGIKITIRKQPDGSIRIWRRA